MEKTLTDPELKFLRDFVEEVLITCANDCEYVTGDLYAPALTAGEILGLKKEDMENLE